MKFIEQQYQQVQIQKSMLQFSNFHCFINKQPQFSLLYEDVLMNLTDTYGRLVQEFDKWLTIHELKIKAAIN